MQLENVTFCVEFFGLKGSFIVTLHFLLQRKQREVAKENEFYYELLIQSLPLEQQEAYHLRNSASHVSFLSSISLCLIIVFFLCGTKFCWNNYFIIILRIFFMN